MGFLPDRYPRHRLLLPQLPHPYKGQPCERGTPGPLSLQRDPRLRVTAEGPRAPCLCTADPRSHIYTELWPLVKSPEASHSCLAHPPGKRAQNVPDRGRGEKATAFLPGMFPCPSGRWGRIAGFLLQDVRGEGGQRFLLPLLTERFSHSINLEGPRTGSGWASRRALPGAHSKWELCLPSLQRGAERAGERCSESAGTRLVRPGAQGGEKAHRISLVPVPQPAPGRRSVGEWRGLASLGSDR